MKVDCNIAQNADTDFHIKMRLNKLKESNKTKDGKEKCKRDFFFKL